MKLKRKTKLKSEIPTASMPDIIFMLLIIFMITAPLVTAGVKVDLPSADAEPMSTDDEPPLVASIDKSGNYYLSVGDSRDKSLTEDELIDLIKAQQALKPNTQIVVNGDRDVAYGRVIRLMVLLQENAGMQSIGLMTEPLEDN